jgi:hypothetical protein
MYTVVEKTPFVRKSVVCLSRGSGRLLVSVCSPALNGHSGSVDIKKPLGNAWVGYISGSVRALTLPE